MYSFSYRYSIALFVFITIILLQSCETGDSNADLIFLNAKIWTGNPDLPYAEAMAIRSDSILAIGTYEQVSSFKSQKTELVDVQNKLLTPGFIDSHVHLMTGGRSLLSVDLRDANTKEEFVERIRNYASKLEPGDWILEGNWDHTLWGGELPKKSWIDGFTQSNPVFIYRLDGHMALANSAALREALVDRKTQDIEGGTIVRDASRNPTGILKDNAMNLVMDVIPEMDDIQKENVFKAAMDYFLSNGVTSVHDVDGLNNPNESFHTAKKLKTDNELKIRLYAANPLQKWRLLREVDHINDEWIKIGALKGFVDGSLGSHTAAFFEEYEDIKYDKGFFINTSDSLYSWIKGADKAGLHVLVHAIGDSANHTLLNIFNQVIEENGAKDRRFRIEHAQHLLLSDIGRFAELGVIPSMQAYHAIDDGRWAEQYIGKRINTTYAFRSLLDENANLSFGSDWAVAPASPIMGIYAAVTRQTLDGKYPEGWVPEQKISVEEALKAYTINAAFASFDEDIKGSLEKGKLADFVVLSEDLLSIDPEEIQDVQILQTYVGGQKVYDIHEK